MIDCQDCKDDIQKCPYCNCACEVSAKTINTDEDGYCHRCKKDLFQSDDGLRLLKEDPTAMHKTCASSNPANHLFFYWQKVKEIYDRNQPHLRYGQTAFNVLYELRPELANQIVGSDRDPFYSDKLAANEHKGDTKWQNFITFLNNNWYK